MTDVAGTAMALAQACYCAAKIIDRFIEDWRWAETFVSDFRSSCVETQRELGRLKNHFSSPVRGLGHGQQRQPPGFDSHNRNYLSLLGFDDHIRNYLSELDKFANRKDSRIARFISWGRVRIMWHWEFLNRMRQDFLDRRSDVQFMLISFQLRASPPGSPTRPRSPRRRRESSAAELQRELMAAIMHDTEGVVRVCLEHRPDLGLYSHFDGVSFTPLHLAAEWGRVGMIELLVNAGASKDALDSNGSTPLMAALEQGQFSVAEELIRLHANVHLHDSLGKTALHIAARKNLPVAVGLLLDKEADPDAMDLVGETPLHEALRRDKHSSLPQAGNVIEELLHVGNGRRGADPCAGREGGGRRVALQPPLHMAAASNAVDDLTLLAAAAAQRGVLDAQIPTAADSDEPLISFGETALWLAAQNGHLGAVDILINHGAKAWARCRHQEYPTPLWIALAGGHLAIASHLLQSVTGAAPDAVVAHGLGILHKRWHGHQHHIVRLLLGNGADARLRDDSGAEPIHYALAVRDLTTASLLVEHAPDAVDAPDGAGCTPLMHAAGVHGDRNLVLWLLARGADAVWPVSERGCDALNCACLAGDVVRVAAIIGAAGKDAHKIIERETINGNRPLHAAAKAGALEVVRLLLAQGADKDAVSRIGYSGLPPGKPEVIAVAAGYPEVAKLLKEWTGYWSEGGDSGDGSSTGESIFRARTA